MGVSAWCVWSVGILDDSDLRGGSWTVCVCKRVCRCF